MPELKQTKTIVYLLIVFVLLLVVMFIYVIQPIREERAELDAQMQQRKMEIRALEKKSELRASDEPGNLVRLGHLRTQIPERPYPEMLLQDLRLIEASGGIQMNYYNIQVGEKPIASESEPAGEVSGTPSPNGAGSEAQEAGDSEADAPDGAKGQLGQLLYPVKIMTEFNGRYSDVHRMLAEAETMNRLWQVQGMTLSEVEPLEQVSVNETDRTVKCQITFVAYFAPELASYFAQPLKLDHAPAAGRTIPF